MVRIGEIHLRSRGVTESVMRPFAKLLRTLVKAGDAADITQRQMCAYCAACVVA